MIDKLTKAVVKGEIYSYVWSIFTLEAVLYYTSKESLEEEANKILALDKDAFFIRAVHVDQPAADAAHELLRKKFGKMEKATLTEFMTNQVNITKIDIQEIINECNSNAFLNLDTDGMTDTHHGPFYVLFAPKTYIHDQYFIFGHFDPGL